MGVRTSGNELRKDPKIREKYNLGGDAVFGQMLIEHLLCRALF